MNTCKVFPEWLYDYIFVQLGAKERPDPNEFKLNLESGVDKNIDYLGTYFPRSYAESFCIHQNLFSYKPYKERLDSKTSLRILTFGCGTGGDVTGLIEERGDGYLFRGTPGGRNYILYAYYQRILKNKNQENPFSGLHALVERLCQVSRLCLLKQALPPKA